jgi:NAD-dependent DNA ligase
MQNFNGEALNFNSSHRLKRAIDQLIGICSGIAADGELNNAEIAFLSTWLSNNQDVCTEFPGKQITERIADVLADGVVTAEERADLLELLQQISGNFFVETGAAEAEAAAVPGDAVEAIIFEGRRFCFTGKFAYGTRKQCEQAVIARGGFAEASVTLALDYLVLGAGVSKDWKHESYGRKIERALELRDGGVARPVIVAEKDWVALLEI